MQSQMEQGGLGKIFYLMYICVYALLAHIFVIES
jgi:hypothetical protein